MPAVVASLALQFVLANGALAVNDAAKQSAAPAQSAETQAMEAIKNEETRSHRPIKDKWAVVIGVDDFKDKGIPRLRFSTKDAKDFAKFLVEKANFAPDHVLLLLNENASRHNILAAIGDTWLPRRVFEDDLIVIFASTHGSPKEIDVGGDNFLVAYDTFQDELFTSGIKLQDLAPTIKQRTHCDRVVLILDACNSGAADVSGGKGLFRNTNFDVNALAGRGQIVISSSDADQRSWESKRYQNGVFTHNLIEVLNQEKEHADLGTAFTKLKDKVEQEVKFDRRAFQTPVMHSKWEGEPLKITAKPVSPRTLTEDDSPYTYKKIVEMQLKGVVIPTGEAGPAVAATSGGVTMGGSTGTAGSTNVLSGGASRTGSAGSAGNAQPQGYTAPQATAPSVTAPPANMPQANAPVLTTPAASPYAQSATSGETPAVRKQPTGKEMEYWLRFQQKRH